MFDQPPRTFEELVEPFEADIQQTARWLRELILDAFPQVEESIHGGAKVANALYSVGSPNAVALGLQPGPRFVKLFIHDPDLLGKPSFKLEGTGKHMRHIKFAAPAVDRVTELVDLMRIPVDRRT